MSLPNKPSSPTHPGQVDKTPENLSCCRNWSFWRDQFVYRATAYRTTWKLRLLAPALLLLLLMTTRAWWVPAIGWSLACTSSIESPDVILIDNVDTNYHLFEMAADLKARAVGDWVLVPVTASPLDPQEPGLASRAIVDAMARVAHLDSMVLLPVKGGEPITLNVAREVRDFLKGTEARKVLLLTAGFKSKRLLLIFSRVLGEADLEVCCLPVWGTYRPETWTSRWHGIQEVVLQHVKLAYYRLWVLQ